MAISSLSPLPATPTDPCNMPCLQPAKRGFPAGSVTKRAPTRSWRSSGRRAGPAGFWADPNFAPLPAENSVRLKGERGRFTLVEGKVLSVRESSGTLYLNFGRHWTRDFSFVVPRRLERAFATAGFALKRLAGRHVQVRGFIEQRLGPIIEADEPAQIELIDNSASHAQEMRP
jgi:hypothetical protein